MFAKLINPQYPTAALGLEKKSAAAVQLQKAGRGQFSLRRAATAVLSANLLNPSFDEQNIKDAQELVQTLRELAAAAGMARQKKWSVTLPEAASRAVVMTLESQPASRNELEEVLQWKAERAFGASYNELRVSREKLSPDASGHLRYLAIGMRYAVLTEYERVFGSLGWRTGLILPRHVGEERWLELFTKRAQGGGDSLLISSHQAGFTAALVSRSQPVVARSVICEAEDRDDDLYRFLLFCRDRIFSNDTSERHRSLGSFLLVGNGFTKDRVKQIINETLDTNTKALSADEVGLVNLVSSGISFDDVAAPAGIATMAW
jgi:hypothetical protein